MKKLLQIFFLLLTWFTSLANATPVFVKVALPSYDFTISKIENSKEESLVKIGKENFARSGLEVNLFSPKGSSKASCAFNVASNAEITALEDYEKFYSTVMLVSAAPAGYQLFKSVNAPNLMLRTAIGLNKLQNSIKAIPSSVLNSIVKIRNVLNGVVSTAGNLLNAEGKFIDNILETDYLAYVTRKTNAGKTPRPRLEWKEVRDYWLYDSPLARGNAFNKKAVDNGWYPYNEVHLGNGKRLDSYKPPSNGNPGEIVSRKATNLDDIQLSTFESYLDEMLVKYSPGTLINSPKYSPFLDNQVLQGNMFLEIPISNQSISNIQDYINLANSKGITLRFKPE